MGLLGTGFDSEYWCNLDGCGLFCAGFTWFLVCFGEYATVTGVIVPWLGFSMWGILHTVCFSAIAFLCLASHGRAMLTDPGAVPLDAVPVPEEGKPDVCKYRTCKRCKAFKPSRAHHCSICNRCVVKMDHHCPWVRVQEPPTFLLLPSPLTHTHTHTHTHISLTSSLDPFCLLHCPC